jgi:hypothetical protein
MKIRVKEVETSWSVGNKAEDVVANISSLDGVPGLPGRTTKPTVSRNVELVDGSAGTLEKLGIQGNAWKYLQANTRHSALPVDLLGNGSHSF